MQARHRLRAVSLSLIVLAALAFVVSVPLLAAGSPAVAAVRAEDPPADTPPADAPPADAPAADPAGESTVDETPAVEPTDAASAAASDAPGDDVTSEPSVDPSDETTDDPSDEPTDEPTDDPSDDATDEPIDDATDESTDEPIDDVTDEPTEDPVEETADEVADDAVEEEATGSASVSLDFGGGVGDVAAGLPISVSGSGLQPSSRVELWVFSSPRLLATTATSQAGDFALSATLPSDLDPGDHTVVARGIDADGTAFEEATGFTIDADGLIAGVSPGADATGLEIPAMPDSLMAPPYPIVNALDAPAAVVTTAIAGLAVVSVIGVGAGRAASGLGARVAAGESVAGGGINVATADRYDEALEVEASHNRGWRTKFVSTGTAPGDVSVIHRFPGTSFVDEASFVLTAAVATKSPLLSRSVSDAAPIRAMLGSLSLLLPIGAAVLGVIGAVMGNGIAEPPVLAILTVLMVIGVLDALAGLIGALAFTLVVALSGGIIDLGSVRTLMGIALLLVGPGLIGGTFRSIRRLPQPGGTYVWERLADFVLVPLLGAYTTYNIVLALPPLGGSLFPIADSAMFLALVVLVGLVVKVALEEASARWFPERMATVVPTETEEAGLLQQTVSGLLKISVFVFVSAAFIGNVWQLWVAGLVFAIPVLVSPFSQRFPNLPRLWRLLPEGVPYMGITLLLYIILTTVLFARFGDTSDYARVSFVILMIPDLILGILWWFGRQGADDEEVRWFLRPSMAAVYRVGGVAILVITVLLAYRASL